MKQLHSIQLGILKKLIFASKLNYSDLKPSKRIENNKLNFHLGKLLDLGYVQKTQEGYQLTTSGKEYTTRIDTDTVSVMKQAKLSAWFGCMRENTAGKLEFLIYTRLKQPFYGCQGFGGGKIAFGEKIIDAARRELKEETGLEGKPEIVKMVHYRVFNSANELLEDKIMFLCKVLNPTGKIKKHTEEGKFEWVLEEKLTNYIKNPFESIENFLEQVENIKTYNGKVIIQEIDHISTKF